MLRYLNSFECISGNLLICDPFSTNINADHYQLATANSCHICISAEQGVWYAYHLFNSNGTPYGIYLHHSSIYPHVPTNFMTNWHKLGKVCVAFSHTSCIVDKAGYNNSTYTYLSYAEDAIYDVESIFEWLMTSNLPQFKKDYFKHRLEVFQNSDFISGAELHEIFKDTTIGGISNLWSIDCRYRLHNGMKFAAIRYGIVSAAETFSGCYCPNTDDSDIVKECIVLIKDNINANDGVCYLNTL